jgi:hypothetical protein
MRAQIVKELVRVSTLAVCVVACDSAVAQVGGNPTIPLPPSVYEYVENSTSDYGSSAPSPITNGVATASTGYYPGQGVASLTINAGSSDYQLAGASETWQFEVLGPAALASTPVPVVLNGSGSLSVGKASDVTNADDANAMFYSPIFALNLTQDQSHYGVNNFNIAVPANVTINTFYDITERISGYSIISNPGATTDLIKASIDPDVVFGPNFNSAGYSLAFSPVSPVPEPTTATLMLGGLCVLGAFALKNRART